MPTWYATGAGNINSAGRFNSLPNGTGTTLTWPPASGDILVANGFVVTVNVSVNLGSGELRVDTTGGATAGGRFNCGTAGVSVTANIVGGGAAYVLNVSNAGTTFLVGNISGGAGAAQHGIVITQGTANVTGNITGGGTSTSFGVLMNDGTLNQVGNALGGAGDAIRTSVATNVVSITGNATAGAAYALVNFVGGTVTLSGFAQASTTQAAALNNAQGVVTVGETRSASNGRGAVLGAFRFASATAAKSLPIINGSQRTLSVLDVAALVPAVEDVRAGVVYGDGAYTGTVALQRKRQSMAGRF